eukprot:CAMPEP_0178855164 /NCGR_PEP_ID=MMETSP0746-20121128/23242_1 /TAXON_ID=913974 /ORGANISM="Nitzschia punctata, Strain CCMP561" /LENGTH=193 /DNA_ID=CAMNT_0020521243 /DNA_START=28 /DNA_END=609 /DNA_ORIENTATION=-
MNVVHNFTEWNFQIVLAVSLVWTIFLLCFVAYFLMSMSEVRRENGRDVANEQQASEMTKKELTEKECRQFFGRLFEQNGNQRVLGNQDEEVSDVEMGCEESTLQSGVLSAWRNIKAGKSLFGPMIKNVLTSITRIVSSLIFLEIRTETCKTIPVQHADEIFVPVVSKTRIISHNEEWRQEVCKNPSSPFSISN